MNKSVRRTLFNQVIGGIALIAVASAMSGFAAESPGDDAPYVEHAEYLTARFQGLITQIGYLREEAKGASGNVARIINRRLDRKTVEMLETVDRLATKTLEEEKGGGDVSNFRPLITDSLENLPDTLLQLIAKNRRSLRELADKSTEVTGMDRLAILDNRNNLDQRIDILYRALMKNRELAQAYGLDISKQDASLTQSLSERAARLSIVLELAQENVGLFAHEASTFPDNKDVALELDIATDLVQKLTESLSETVDMMAVLNMETDEYRQQLIVARGAVTLDIFDPNVLWGLVTNWGDKVAGWAAERMPQLFINLFIFILIMLIFSKLGNLAKRLVTKSFDASDLHISQLLRDITIATVKNVVLLIGLLIALAQMGVSVGPLLAGLGVAGFVIGFALQDTLGNFASGMMILLYRPFDVDDVVEIGGVFGTVRSMNMVNTTLLTFDNQTLILPNSKIWQEVIKNVTAQSKRRVDLVFGISYSDDIPRAEKILSSILAEHDLILKDPEPVVRLHELADSSVNFVVRPWVKTDDYWDVYWDVTREVKLRFDREGVSIPFPQQDVHVHSEALAVVQQPAGSGTLVMQGHVPKKAALPGEGGDNDD